MKGVQKMYKYYEQLLQKHGLTNYKVYKMTGIPQSTLSAWKNGISKPKRDKLKILGDLFGVPVEYFETGELPKHESTSGKAYYFDDASAEIAQEIYGDPNTKLLLEASRGSTPENIVLAAEMLNRMKRTNPDG